MQIYYQRRDKLTRFLNYLQIKMIVIYLFTTCANRCFARRFSSAGFRRLSTSSRKLTRLTDALQRIASSPRWKRKRPIRIGKRATKRSSPGMKTAAVVGYRGRSLKISLIYASRRLLRSERGNLAGGSRSRKRAFENGNRNFPSRRDRRTCPLAARRGCVAEEGARCRRTSGPRRVCASTAN